MSTNSPPPDPTPAELAAFDLQRLQAEGAYTETWHEQAEVEERIFLLRRSLKHPTPLYRDKHIAWLLRSLQTLPRGFHAFDALQGWAAFWIIHALDLLDVQIATDTASIIVRHFNTCKDPQGGYGGGPGQSAHLASTFSVVMALCALGTDEALRSVDVNGVGAFIARMKREDGSFRVSVGGETDVRACYCAIAVASLLGLLEGEGSEVYVKGCAEYIGKLQGFDGGLGGEIGTESHGGNSYCGVATLAILKRLDVIDCEALLDWAVMRQMGFEGGFQGRTNKLVDSCYSFWVGGLFALLGGGEMFDAKALQRYVLDCCQVENGGMRDKPGTNRDFMHTCYALSGLSMAEHYGKGETLGLKKTNVKYNLSEDKFENAWSFFRNE